MVKIFLNLPRDLEALCVRKDFRSRAFGITKDLHHDTKELGMIFVWNEEISNDFDLEPSRVRKDFHLEGLGIRKDFHLEASAIRKDFHFETKGLGRIFTSRRRGLERIFAPRLGS